MKKSQDKEAAAQLFHARHHLSNLLDEQRTSTDPKADKVFELEAAALFMNHHYGSTISQLQDLGKSRITYKLLWTLYPPNSLIFFLDQLDQPIVARVLSTSYEDRDGGNQFRVRCDYVDCNGIQIGFVRTTVKIPEFFGILDVASLRKYPLDCHADAEAMKARLIRRGRKAHQLVGRHMQTHKGLVLGDWDRSQKMWEKFSVSYPCARRL